LTEFLKIADEQVQGLRRELKEDPAASETRQQAARQRAIQERQQRVAQALGEMEKIEARYAARNAHGYKKRKKPPGNGGGNPPQDKREPRASTTDPEARNMKFPCGGFRPGFNVQFATDTGSGIIVGLDVINRGDDWEELPPMLDQLHQRYARCPTQSLVDGGFAKFDAVREAESRGCEVFAPLPSPKNAKLAPHQPRPKDPPEIAQWRLRMATDEAKKIYKERAANAEWVNAQARNRGLQQFPVRGMKKAKAVVLWYALAHNLMQSLYLLTRPQPA
jgi:hypothetical protein